MFKYLIVIPLLFLGLFSFAQQSIRGVVVNEKEEPVIAATVSILKQDSTLVSGVATNTKGEFSVNLNSKEDVLLRISSIGYKTAFAQLSDEYLKVILKEEATSIDEVVVVSDKILTEAEKDIIFVTETDRKNVASASDLISSLPQFSLNRVNNKINTSDGEPLLILINGIEADATKLLSLNPKKVKKIEHYQLPPARFSNLNTHAVINVITYENKEKGLDLNISANNSFTDGYGTNVVGIGVHDSINALEFQYFIDYRKFDDIFKNQKIQYATDDVFSNYQGVPGDYNGVYNRLTTEYKRTTKINSFSARLVYRDSRGDEDYTQNIVQSSAQKEQSERRNRKLEDAYRAYALDIYNACYFKNDKVLGVNIVGTLSDANSTSILSVNSSLSPSSNYSYTDFNNNESYSAIGELFYSQPIHRFKWTIGAKNYFKFLEQTYNNTHTSKLKQNKTYFYSGISGKIKGNSSFSYNIGVENTDAFIDRVSSSQKQSRAVLKSSLSVLVPLAQKHNLRFNSYLSSNVPSITDMADNRVFLDQSLIYRGEPNMTPYYVWGNQLRYQFSTPKLYFSPSIRYQSFMKPYLNAFIKEGDYIVKTYRQFDQLQDLYASLVLSWKPVDFFNLQTTYGFSYVSLHIDNEESYSFPSHYLSLKFLFNYENWRLSLENIEPYENMQGEIINQYGRSSHMQLSYSKNNISAAAWFWHQPNSSGYRTNSKFISMEEEKIWEGLRSVLGVKLTYNLQVGKKNRSSNKLLKNEDNSSGFSKNNTANF